MSYLLRGVYQLPFEPNDRQEGKINDLVAQHRWMRFLTGRRLVSVVGHEDLPERCEALLKGFGVRLHETLRCKVQANLSWVPLGEKVSKYEEFAFVTKPVPLPPVVDAELPEIRVMVSASYGRDGGRAQYSVSYMGKVEVLRSDEELGQVTSLNEALMLALKRAVHSAGDFCDVQGMDPSSVLVILISPSEYLVKVFRGEWKITENCTDAACEANQELNHFVRSHVRFEWLPEVLRKSA